MSENNSNNFKVNVDGLFGRRKIFTSVADIDETNVIYEVNRALEYHITNMAEEDYLYWYRRGVQPILNRVKEIRPEICNKIVVNNAEQVVAFKNGYFLQKPISYVSRKADEKITEKVREYNEYIYTSGKHQADNAVVDWFHTVGLGALFVEPSRKKKTSKPVNVYALDPRSAFVVYSLRPGNRPVMGVNMVVDRDYIVFDVFTERFKFTLSGGYVGQRVNDGQHPIGFTAVRVDMVEPNILGLIPIIEYTYSSNRMAAFECAISVMDAINTVESNRVDGVEQEVQQLCVATNCQFEEGVTANTIREAGMICVKSTNENRADFKILSETLDQAQTQVTLDDLYSQMLFKCSMPTTMSGGKSTSDTGTAVYLRDGFQTADTAARNTQDLFEESERLFDEVFLRILELDNGFDLQPEDFSLRMERNSASNLLVKSQSALNMKELGLAPQIAFERSGLSADPLTDILVSEKYIKMKWDGTDMEGNPIDKYGQPVTENGVGQAVTPEGRPSSGNGANEPSRPNDSSSSEPGKRLSSGTWINGYWRRDPEG